MWLATKNRCETTMMKTTEVKNNFNKQTELENLISDMVPSVLPYVQGLMIVGTMAHSKDYAIRQSSDVDSIVLCQPNDIPEILNSKIFDGYSVDVSTALKYIADGETDIMSTRHELGGNLFTMHFMSPKIFEEKFANGITPQKLYSFRKVPKEYIYRFNNFAGDSIAVPVENEKIEKGFKVPMETSRIVNELYYSGSPHNKLMSNPDVLIDKENIINASIQNMKMDMAKRLLYEQGKEVDFQKYSVVNTLVRKHKITPSIKNEIYSQEKNIYERLIK